MLLARARAAASHMCELLDHIRFIPTALHDRLPLSAIFIIIAHRQVLQLHPRDLSASQICEGEPTSRIRCAERQPPDVSCYGRDAKMRRSDEGKS